MTLKKLSILQKPTGCVCKLASSVRSSRATCDAAACSSLPACIQVSSSTVQPTSLTRTPLSVSVEYNVEQRKNNSNQHDSLDPLQWLHNDTEWVADSIHGKDEDEDGLTAIHWACSCDVEHLLRS